VRSIALRLRSAPWATERETEFPTLILNYDEPKRPFRQGRSKAFTLAPDEEPVEHFGEIRLPGNTGIACHVSTMR
jgi:hypothetical protein